MRIYLAGPMGGLKYGDANDWRQEVIKELSPYGIDCYSPLRWKEFLDNDKKISTEGTRTKAHPLATSKGIMRRDFTDVKNADVILAYFLGSGATSMGTVMEVAWSYLLQKPLVVVAEPKNAHAIHPMMMEAIDYHVHNLKDGMDIVKAILLPK